MSKPKPGSHSSPITARRSANSRATRAGIAQRRAGAGLDAEHFSVGAEQRGLQQPRAFAALFEHMAEPRREPLDRAEHVALVRDRLGEALLGERGRERAGAA